MEQLRTYTGLKAKSATAACSVLRHILTNYVLDKFAGVKFGDRPNTAVCIDETWFTQKKRNISGFCGRLTRGHKTMVLELYELDTETRMGTGRVMLVTIPNRKRKILEREIRKRVAAGALILGGFVFIVHVARQGRIRV